MWRRNWVRIATMFSDEEEIRRVIYTTNTMESVGSFIRKAITRTRCSRTMRLPEGGLAGDHGCFQKMDHADPEPEVCTEPLLYRIRRKDFDLPQTVTSLW